MSPSNERVTLFDIGFTSEVDGPGQRMVVYFKGCNLRCPWCAAPESLDREPQVLFYAGRADDPEDACSVCPFGAVRAVGGGLSRDIEACSRCTSHDCVRSRHPAFERVGRVATVQDLIDKAVRYRPFFGARGGVTVGGGEPTLQFAALRALLLGLKQRGIHTAIETNGTSPDLPALSDPIDLLFVDLKYPRACALYGRRFEQVVRNIAARQGHGGPMVVRIPLVAGFNADLATAQAFGARLSSIGPLTVELLPYHARALVKWEACGRPYPVPSLRTPTDSERAAFAEALRAHGLSVR